MQPPTYNLILRAGRFDTANGSTPEQLTAFIASLKRSPPQRLVLYFHGGLTPLASGLGNATILAPHLQAVGAASIFVIWESGWQEIIEQNLPAIFHEPIFQAIQQKVAQILKGKIEQTAAQQTMGALALPSKTEVRTHLAEARTGSPLFRDAGPDDVPDLTEDEKRAIEFDVERDADLRTALQDIVQTGVNPTAAAATDVAARASPHTLMSPDVLAEIVPAAAPTAMGGFFSMLNMAKHIIAVVAAIIERLHTHRDHGLYLTITEEILREFYIRNVGKFLWDGMKTEVSEAFDPASASAGKALIEALQGLWASGVKPTITLVGHSAGAIYAARMLSEMQKANLPAEMKCDVILIAPACTFQLFSDTLQAAGNRIGGLRIFGMGDERERQNALFPPIFNSSLLYFVSGVIEDAPDMPLVGMQRYYSVPYEGPDFTPLDPVRKAEKLILPHAFAWAEATGFQGGNCDMRSHGGWLTEAPQTLASVLYLIQAGFPAKPATS